MLEAFERDAEARRGARRARSRPAACRTPTHGAQRLLRDRARPRPRRNLARFDGVRYGLRAEDAATWSRCTRETRHDGFGAEVKRRIMLGTYALSSGYYDAYYGRAQRVRTKIADDFKTAFESVDFVVTPTAPTVAFKLGEQGRRPAGDVPQRLLHGADVAGRHPGDLDPQRAQRGPARSASSSPARRSARTASSTPPTRSSRRSASTARSPRCVAELRSRHRAGDPRPARHADEDVLRLRAELRRAAEHAHLPGLPRPARRAAGRQRARRSTSA